jgi:23S rRNA pseudouridine1911/1915/1917 synthase
VGRNVERGDSWTVEQDGAGIRLDKFLSAEARLGSRGRATEAIQRGKVFLNDREAAPEDAAVKLVAGDRVRVWVDRPGTSRSGFRPRKAGELEILYEDEWLLVVNKPAGLLVVPLPQRDGTPTVYDQVQHHLRPRGKRRPLIVHRIDRDTSGLVVFAKDAGAQERLKEQFRRREPERVYQAIVYGHPSPSSGTWCDRLLWDRKSLIQKQTHASDPRGREAISEYRVVERFEAATLIEVRLVTGKRNQIRLQARLRGHTLVGEQRYIYGPDEIRTIDFPRQALHAWRLGFRHPDDGRELRFEAALPADMEALIRRLRR